MYFTVGGLGGVVGPWVYFLAVDFFGSWRMHWGIAGVALAVASVIAIILLREGQDEEDHAEFVTQNLQKEDNTSSIYRTAQEWTAKQALKTWQFYVIAAAYTSFLLCGITVNSFSVAHVTDIGFSAEVAAGLLSTQAFINAFSRVGSGLIGEWLEPKKLLIGSLALMIIGLLSLSFANSWAMLVIFTIGIGVGYGMTFLATSILLSNYYGRGPYLELFSVMNLISTLACFSPFFAGAVKDAAGSFMPAFLAITVIPVIVLIATLVMRPPQHTEDSNNTAQAYS